MTKPTLEEQIACMSDIVAFGNEMRLSILSSLKELQSIRSAELPVEPMRWMHHNTCGNDTVVVSLKDYNDLKSFALKERALATEYLRDTVAANFRAEKAESELAALRGRLIPALRVCRTALHEVCHLPREYDINADPDKITLKTGRAFALADSLLVDADQELIKDGMSAVALKEGK